MALYTLKHIVHRYDGAPVLTIGRWEMQAETITGVLGPNGSGKSTLLSLLGFIMPPTRGEICFNGRPARPFADAVRGKVALLPQDSFLLKRSVYQNIAYGLKALDRNGTSQERLVEAMLMVGLDWNAYARRPWYALSGGEARRVALAARLALRPEVLILDEPTTSVDAASVQLIKDAALHARRQWGTALVIASHDTDWLEDICTDTLHLYEGRPMGSGRRTLLFGPWEKQGPDAVMALTASQYFRAAKPPQDLLAAVVAIEAKHLALQRPSRAVAEGQQRLRGLLLRISFEQSTGLRCAAVLVGNITLTVYLSDEAEPSLHQPGQSVQVIYDPSKVAWY